MSVSFKNMSKRKYDSFNQSGSSRMHAAARTISRAWKRSRGTRSFATPPRVGRIRWADYSPHAAVAAFSGVRSMFTGAATSMRVGKQVQDGAGGSTSSFTIKNKDWVSKTVNKVTAPVKSVYNSAQQIKSSVGQQMIFTGLVMYDNADSLQCLTDTAGGAFATSRYIAQHCAGYVMMTNIFESAATIDIYDIVARKDSGTAATATALAAWVQGDVDEAATLEYRALGSTPWQTDLFNQYYKVLQKTRLVVGPGATHKHSVRIDANKLMTAEYIANTPKIFRNLTYNCLVVITGQPANDITTQAQVTLGISGMNVVSGKEYVSREGYLNIAKVVDHTTLLNAFTNGEQVVNVGGTTIGTNTEG